MLFALGRQTPAAELWIRDPLTACSFVDLKPDTEYEVEVRSKNSSGESEPVLVNVRTNPAGSLAY